jgi:hypothetical protein
MEQCILAEAKIKLRIQDWLGEMTVEGGGRGKRGSGQSYIGYLRMKKR